MLLDYGVLLYLDNMLLYLHDMTPHYELLHKDFTMLVKHQFHIKQSKYHIFLESVSFLGHFF